MTACGVAPTWLNDPVRTVPVFSYAPLIIVGLILIAVVARIFWRARREGRRLRMVTAGCVAVGIVLLGSFIAWRGQHVQRGPSPDQVAALNRLGFPLELPSVPGYFPMGGFVLSGNALLIGMGRGRKANLEAGQTQSSVLSVRFYRTSDSEGAMDLSNCTSANPQFTCQVKGPGTWLVTAPGMSYHEVIARKPNMIIVACGDSGAKVPDSVLLQAITSLQPTTAAQIASLALPNAS